MGLIHPTGNGGRGGVVPHLTAFDATGFGARLGMDGCRGGMDGRAPGLLEWVQAW